MIHATAPRRALLRAAAGLPLAAGAAAAQEPWPTRPVRIIVPFPPGQAADLFTRVLADELSRRWPARAFVENRGGGAGAPALEAGARAAPDGYTLTAGTSGTLGVNPSVLRSLPYDAERDFAFLGNVVSLPLVIAVHPSFPARDLAGLLAALRARPGQVALGLPGAATSQHMAAELLMHRTGTRFNNVLYRGSGPAVTDLLAGTVPAMFDTVASALSHLRSGATRAIAVTTPARAPQLPEVPTVAESGLPGTEGYAAFGWSGLVAPAATPAPVLRRIADDAAAVLRDPAVAARFMELGGTADPMTPVEFERFVRAEIAKWREVARIADVRLDG